MITTLSLRLQVPEVISVSVVEDFVHNSILCRDMPPTLTDRIQHNAVHEQETIQRSEDLKYRNCA